VEPARSDTPMMRQYRALKRQAGEALLFFRMGDFYELFEADAEKAAALLDLVLTSREKDSPAPVPMCGVPFHALEGTCAAASRRASRSRSRSRPRTRARPRVW
jgi:DNA mismatch repair protein MutS